MAENQELLEVSTTVTEIKNRKEIAGDRLTLKLLFTKEQLRTLGYRYDEEEEQNLPLAS